MEPSLTHARALVGRGGRMLGIVGPPGSGKSTFAAALVAALPELHAVVLPMDGFHLPNAVLTERRLSHVKGAPETFDARGFVDVLRRVRAGDTLVRAPRFDRVAEEPVADDIGVDPTAQLVVVEGNYLLLDGEWRSVRSLLDEVWYLVVPPARRLERLVLRHVHHGRSPEAAWEWVHRSDEANTALIEATQHRADVLVDPDRPFRP